MSEEKLQHVRSLRPTNRKSWVAASTHYPEEDGIEHCNVTKAFSCWVGSFAVETIRAWSSQIFGSKTPTTVSANQATFGRDLPY